MKTLKKPYALVENGPNLSILLQDGKDEAPENQWGEIRWKLPPTIVDLLRKTKEGGGMVTTYPITTPFRRFQNLLVFYFQLIEDRRFEEAERFAKELDKAIEQFEDYVTKRY